jgi:hypothetical protein
LNVWILVGKQFAEEWTQLEKLWMIKSRGTEAKDEEFQMEEDKRPIIAWVKWKEALKESKSFVKRRIGCFIENLRIKSQWSIKTKEILYIQYADY